MFFFLQSAPNRKKKQIKTNDGFPYTRWHWCTHIDPSAQAARTSGPIPSFVKRFLPGAKGRQKERMSDPLFFCVFMENGRASRHRALEFSSFPMLCSPIECCLAESN